MEKIAVMASGIGHRASGIGHRASGIGHRASGIGHRWPGHGAIIQTCQALRKRPPRDS